MTTPRIVPLGEICTFVGGGTPSRKVAEYFQGDIPWATVKDFKSYRIVDTEEHISKTAVIGSATNIVEPGTVLMVSRVGLGKAAIAGCRLAINQDIKAVTPNGDVSPEYLFWFLLSQAGKIQRMGAGATVKGVTLADIKSILMPLPSLPEQHRLVDILSRAEGIVRLRREAEKKAAELIPALFIDLFGDPATNPKGWPAMSLGELIQDGPQNGLYKHASHYGDGTPILRIDAFYDGRVLDIDALKRVRITSEEGEKFRLTSRNIVINRVNSVEYLGKSAIIPPLPEATVFESNMMRFAVDESRVLPEFVIELLQTGHAKAHFLSKAKHAINQSSINQQDVKSIRVPLPPLDKQRNFTEQVAAIRSIQSQQSAATAKAQASFDALLAEAFGG
jgi:type I restriction enzyme S subunit